MSGPMRTGEKEEEEEEAPEKAAERLVVGPTGRGVFKEGLGRALALPT